MRAAALLLRRPAERARQRHPSSKITLRSMKACSCQQPMTLVRMLPALRLLLAQMSARLPSRAVGGPARKSSIRAAFVVSGQRPLLPQPMLAMSQVLSGIRTGTARHCQTLSELQSEMSDTAKQCQRCSQMQ